MSAPTGQAFVGRGFKYGMVWPAVLVILLIGLFPLIYTLIVSFQNFDITDAAVDVDAVVAGVASMDFQVGVLSGDVVAVTIDNVGTGAAGLNIAAATIETATNAGAAGDALDTAMARLNTARAGVGSLMARFEYASANLATSIENLDAARSTLMDVDVASEMSNFASKQVLVQASAASFRTVAILPALLLIVFGAIWLRDRAKGGYKPEKITG